MKKIINIFSEQSILIKKITSNFNVFSGIFKLILAVISSSILLFFYSFYNIGIGIAKKTSMRENQKHKYENYYLVGIIVLITSISYILYSDYIYFNGSNANYNMFVAIGIATLAFTNITITIIQIIKAKKIKNIQVETFKLINLSSAFISMALTQTALLSFTLKGDNSKYYGIGGIFFGVLSAIVGIYMIIYTSIQKKAK